MHCYHTCKNMHEFCTSPRLPHSSTPPSHNCKTIQSLYHNDGMLASFSRVVSLPMYFAFPSILISFNLVLVPCYHAAYPQLSSLEIILSLGPPMQQSSTAGWCHTYPPHQSRPLNSPTNTPPLLQYENSPLQQNSATGPPGW